MAFFYAILYLAVLLAAVGQILLKFGADKDGIELGIFRINVWIVMGLGAMLMSMLLYLRGLHAVPLHDMAFILPSVYVLVPVFSKIFLKEQYGRRTLIGTLIIILGIAIFNIPL